jgi:hypothetical protein
MSDPGSLDGGSAVPSSQPSGGSEPAQQAPAPAQRAEQAPNPRSGEEARRTIARDGTARDAAAPATDDGVKHKLGDLELTSAEIKELSARHAAEKSKELLRPRAPDGYKFDLTPEFKAPQGVEFKLNEADPLVAQYREFAFKHGFDQAQFSEGLDMVATLRLADHQQFAAAKAAELGKLGPAAHGRVSAVTQWLTAMGGEKSADAVRVLVQAPTAATVEAFENIMQRFTSQGGASFNRRGTEHGDPNAGKIPGYATMSFEQRRQAQDQERNRGR